MIAKAYLTILFITMTIFIIFNPLDPEAQPVYGSGDDVANYTSGTYELFTSGINDIYDTVEIAMDTANAFVDAILFIPRVLNDLTGNTSTVGEICTPYADLSFLERTYMNAQRMFYNVTNPYLTAEEYWLYEQERVWGLECS